MSNTSADFSTSDSLTTYRAQIDAFDTEILQLLAQRIDVVKQIGVYKKTQSVAALDPKRWQSILDKLEVKSELLGLDFELVKDLWNRIHTYTVSLEERL